MLQRAIEAACFACAWGVLGNLSISVYAHRALAHRAVRLDPIAAHFFRFCIWLTTGTHVRPWVAVHRKHHAFADREGDPHSPVTHGLKTIVLNLRQHCYPELTSPQTLTRFGQGCPDDWMERNVYEKWGSLGVLLLLGLQVALFGALPGLLGFALTLLWIPSWAGVINGLGHRFGYRNFQTEDASRNIVPAGVLAAGEELHNNHHRYSRSAKFSVRAWEIDLGWLAIRALYSVGLADDVYVFGEPWPASPPRAAP